MSKNNFHICPLGKSTMSRNNCPLGKSTKSKHKFVFIAAH